ncbi:hexosaminidase [Nakamurella panacisegetis]|uniref:beta-N-acetylhexosaminidase n=1 Tax=Nakamurella panacisegetis TaxID=1090615 RepID=A0A1H0SGL6_9ACTN|nr:beta-N-acetylhexosaminidase [Nakamurella panacisegetis]SDP40932.1 hexosaminidase [Nakamurella panacisegetis]
MVDAPTLLPRPATIRTVAGGFELTGDTAIRATDEVLPTAEWLRDALRPATGFRFPIGPATGTGGVIELGLDPDLPAEGYRLVAGPDAVRITGGDAAGVFHGCQSLLQLVAPAVFRRAKVSGVRWALPGVDISDVPRFGWRGAMLDVARHFMPKHDVLRFIDLMAMHKLNVLHLHLTDDQGWRVEIRRYPLLTETGGWRRASQVGGTPDAPTDGRPHGGFYTQDDLREIVAYAAARFVTVVPEVDLPGHSHAAIAAYPALGVTGAELEVATRWGVDVNVLNTEESTVAFYLDVFDEVMELFPSPYIGVGGDECPKDQWKADPRTQELMRTRGLTTEEELQAWFVGRVGAHLNARGRRLYGWDELLEGPLPAGSVIGSWRGLTGAVTAARRGLDVVSCPDDRTYLDYRQSESADEPIAVGIPLTLERVYGFDPVPDGLSPAEAAHVLGGQGNIWSEHVDSPRMVDYFAFPRLCALAEVLWSPDARDFGDFSARLAAHLDRLDAVGVEYRRPSGPQPWQMRPGVPGRPSTLAERDALIRDEVAGIRT